MLKQKLVRSVLNKHKKRDSWFLDDYSVNPYEGCSCNCLYCYIRGSKYGMNMEEGLTIKANALQVFEKQLAYRAKKNQYGIVAIGSGTDAYIHHEKDQLMTRGMLSLLLQFRFPVFISTKCLLIKRDIDLLEQIDKTGKLPADLAGKLKRGLILSVSVSTLDEKISDMLEPGAARPAERLKLVTELKERGFLVGVNAIPLLPFISDTEEEMEKIFAASRESGADYILTGGLTLFGSGTADSKTLFYKFLEHYDASLLSRYEKLYGNRFFTPYLYQDSIKEKSVRLSKKYGIRNSILE